MLTKDAKYLISLCTSFLESKISAKYFCNNFENYFVDDNNDFTEEEAIIFDEILQDIAYFVPDKEERQAEPTYIDETELRKRTQVNLEKVSKLI